jgi:hypothetical protein
VAVATRGHSLSLLERPSKQAYEHVYRVHVHVYEQACIPEAKHISSS